MNYTENYQLPQWEETDRVLMEDFNAAMARIEQGIENVRAENPLVKLQTIAAENASQPLEVSWVDWDLYRALHIYFELEFAATEQTGTIRLNNVSSNNAYLLSSSNMQDYLCSFATRYIKKCSGVLQLMPGGSGFLGTMDYVGHYPGHGQASCQVVSAATLETVDFHLSAAPTSGSYRIYGLLK